MTDNQKVKKIRAYLKLRQSSFAAGLNMKQGSISDIERERIGISLKLKKELEKVFYIDPSYWKSDKANMFLPGKEQEALDKAEALKADKKEENTEEEPEAPLTRKIEELNRELAYKNELLAAKEETIVILKGQVKDWKQQMEDFKKQYAKLEEERVELKLELNAVQKKFQRTGTKRRSG